MHGLAKCMDMEYGLAKEEKVEMMPEFLDSNQELLCRAEAAACLQPGGKSSTWGTASVTAPSTQECCGLYPPSYPVLCDLLQTGWGGWVAVALPYG